jgi:Short C-terminal domain
MFLLVAPAAGLIAYLGTNSQGSSKRTARHAAARGHYDGTSNGADPASQINQAKTLLDSGAISQDEYSQLKARALSA